MKKLHDLTFFAGHKLCRNTVIYIFEFCIFSDHTESPPEPLHIHIAHFLPLSTNISKTIKNNIVPCTKNKIAKYLP